MQAWLQDWYGVSYEPQMTRSDMGQMEMMVSMAGAEFETEFMRAMSRHHEMAIVNAARCVELADHGELVSLFETIIETQSAEIEQMQSWLCEWYDECEGNREEAAHG